MIDQEKFREFFEGAEMTKYAHCRGYYFLKEIIILRSNTTPKYSIIQLYKEVGENNNSTYCQVERAIRHLIVLMTNDKFIEKRFGWDFKPVIKQVVEALYIKFQ